MIVLRPRGMTRAFYWDACVTVMSDARWHGVSTGLTSREFGEWRWWMLVHEPVTYFAWARVLARQEIAGRS